jgi:hypothetical protein
MLCIVPISDVRPCCSGLNLDKKERRIEVKPKATTARKKMIFYINQPINHHLGSDYNSSKK